VASLVEAQIEENVTGPVPALTARSVRVATECTPVIEPPPVPATKLTLFPDGVAMKGVLKALSAVELT
jgi:hypothetical protein